LTKDFIYIILSPTTQTNIRRASKMTTDKKEVPKDKKVVPLTEEDKQWFNASLETYRIIMRQMFRIKKGGQVK